MGRVRRYHLRHKQNKESISVRSETSHTLNKRIGVHTASTVRPERKFCSCTPAKQRMARTNEQNFTWHSVQFTQDSVPLTGLFQQHATNLLCDEVDIQVASLCLLRLRNERRLIISQILISYITTLASGPLSFERRVGLGFV